MDVMSYLEWRGDISIAGLPLCEADYAVFGCCSYFPYDGVVPEGFGDTPVSLWNAVTRIRELAGLDGDGRSFHYKEDDEMTEILLTCPRFTSIGLVGFRNIIDVEKQEQFAAVTMLLPNRQKMIVFRGTDKTLTGWKEDFNMMYLEHVPSQEDAVKYIEEAAAALDDGGDIYICGHSKGGNLAVYAAAYCSEKVRSRIKQIVSLDGPGFELERTLSDEFVKIKDRIYSFIPQQSVVGMMLEQFQKSSVIHSRGAAFWQHSLYTWEIRRGDFIRETDVKNLSRNVDATLTNWLISLDKEKREKVVEGCWKVVEASGVDNVDDLFTFKSTINMLKSMGKIDDETKDVLSEAVKLFKKAYKKMHTDNREIRKEKRRKKTAKEDITEIAENPTE
ncbi:MAG: DUF2974 domain-containing protein [Lachnospiraceae bacterium]|nr:DUF2974 domain-containing protein [Lachnospiraceae bacterium]